MARNHFVYSVVFSLGILAGAFGVHLPKKSASSFAIEALSPALEAATFSPKNYASKAHQKITQQATLGVQGFTGRVQQVIAKTRSRDQALKSLEKDLGWQTTPNQLSAFVSKHRLSAPWRRERLDPARVRSLVANTRSLGEVAKILQRKLRWKGSFRNLSAYLTRHQITTGWREEGHRISPRRVQELIANTATREQAVALLQQELGWPKRANTLSVFITRNNLHAPWKGVSPGHVQELITNTATRGQAVALLQQELGWPKRANTLSVFMMRNDLHAPWSKLDRGHASATRSSA